MPPVTDTDIAQWQDDYTAADTNTPKGPSFISTLLDDELRNIKSVVRKLSKFSTWTPLAVPVTINDSSSVTIPGNWVDVNKFNQKMMLLDASGNPWIGYITNMVYSGGNTVVSLTADIHGTAMPTSISAAYLSAIAPLGNALPAGVLTTYYEAFACYDCSNVGTDYTAIRNNRVAQLFDGQVWTVRFNLTNSTNNPVTLKLTGTPDFPAKPVRKTRAQPPFGSPQITELTAGDICGGAYTTVRYDGNGDQFLMETGSASSVTVHDLNNLFAASTSTFDTTNCVSGGGIRLLGIGLQWCKTKPILAGGSGTQITMPFAGGTQSIESVLVGYADSVAFALQGYPWLVNVVDANTITLWYQSSNTNQYAAAYILSTCILVPE